MEEIVAAEDDVEPQFNFVVHTRTLQYHVKLMTKYFSITSSVEKIQVPLEIDQTIYWLYNDDGEIAFGLKKKDEIKYFYGEQNELRAFRNFIGCRISFGTFNQDYVIGCLLGKGTFSEVIKVTDLRDGKDYAMKKIKLRNEGQLKNLKMEIEILHSLCHEGVIKVYDVYKLSEDCYGLIIELVIGQSLDSVLSKQKQLKSKLEERDIQMILKQALEIVNYLHSHNVMHRDLKPQHIILCSQRAIKIIDFGLSSKCTDQQFCGTPGYMPPESFRENTQCTQKGDIFSLGVVFYRLLNKGVSCFDATTLESVLSKNRRCVIEYQMSGYSSQAVHLLKLMLEKDPSCRIDSTNALNHLYFTEPRESPTLKEDKGNIYVYYAHPRPSHLSRTCSGEELKTIK